MGELRGQWHPETFASLDLRAFLADDYTAAKQHVPAFSYRFFARRAGYSSPNFLKLVIKGDRGLSADSVERFATALGLDDEERRFFRELVAFSQARSDEDRNQAFQRIAASQRFQQARRIERGMYVYLSHWYYPAIREMAARDDFCDDPEWIAKQLLPNIKVKEAQEALHVLLELGLVVRQEDGSLRRGEPTLTTGHVVRNLAIGNYHRQMMGRAQDALKNAEAHQRDFSAVTVCIGAGQVPELRQRIRSFREQIIDVCDRDPNPEVVYQVNFQCFPLSVPPTKDEESS